MDAFIRRLSQGPATATELRVALGVSQPTVSRLVARHARDIAVIGRGRATRYALLRAVRDLGSEFPVYRIGSDGRSAEIGALIAVHGGFAYHDREQGRDDLYPGVPWFLADMRPQGFLGRAFPHQYPELDLPERIVDWSDDQALYAIARRGEDMVGNLVVGEESLTRWIHMAQASLPSRNRARRYPTLAERALTGETPGSSAGGEQPKFLIAVDEPAGLRHLLVKFSEPIRSPSGRRSADLLICEHLALATIAEAGIAAARTQLVESGDRVFLEVERFDRLGPRGRMGLLSLAALDDHFVGERRNWLSTALALQRKRWLSQEDVDRIAWLQAFGGFIANSDMHFNNVSLLYEGGNKLGLAPAYDMLPMLYAPQRGEVRDVPFAPRPPPPRALEQARSAREAALRFWQRCREEPRLSPAMRRIAADNGAALSRMNW